MKNKMTDTVHVKSGTGGRIIHPEGGGRMILLHVRSCLHKLI